MSKSDVPEDVELEAILAWLKGLSEEKSGSWTLEDLKDIKELAALKSLSFLNLDDIKLK